MDLYLNINHIPIHRQYLKNVILKITIYISNKNLWYLTNRSGKKLKNLLRVKTTCTWREGSRSDRLRSETPTILLVLIHESNPKEAPVPVNALTGFSRRLVNGL